MMPDGSWIKIENLKDILNEFRPELYHPDDPRYRPLWQGLRKKCIEGIWVEQFGGWRYVPGNIGFYGVFFRFTDWDEETKIRQISTPKIRDIEWHRAYYDKEAQGFSGFVNDDKYTSDRIIHEIGSGIRISDKRREQLYKPNGKFKEFIEPRENLFRLHQLPVGNMLFWNQSSNHFEMGSRGGGKSYWAAGGELLYDLCFSNLKYYTPGVPTNSKAELEVTSSGGGKATELLEKVKEGMNFLRDPRFPEIGVYSYEGSNEIEPCPFWRKMFGSIAANNKENKWTVGRKVKNDNAEWTTLGNGDYVINTSYSINTKGGARKSAGGRRTKVVHEEIGENILLEDSLGSNEGMVSEAGNKFASQKGIGTSGDMETIQPAKKAFTNPRHYKALVFKYSDYPEDEHGFFVPVYIADPRFKDKDGNTDIEKAKAFHAKELQNLIDSGAPPDVVMNHKVNYPSKIEHMWYGLGGNILPVLEAEAREKELMKGGLYKTIGTAVDLFWDSSADSGVNYKLKQEPDPFFRFPLDSQRKNLEGEFMMYIHPDKLKINGKIPDDAIFTLVDPYVAGEWERGGSLGAVFYIVNPKYIPYGLPGNCIAASYHGKPKAGVDAFGDLVVMGHAFYGNCKHTVWYEANKGGETIRNAFIRKNRFICLAHRPQFEDGHWIFGKKITQTGYLVGSGNNDLGKRVMWTRMADWLLEETTLTINGQTETKLNIERIPDIFFIRQIKEAKIKGLNVDAVSAFQSISLCIGEQEQRILVQNKRSPHLQALNEYIILKSKRRRR